jgi:hypothetical protein
MEQTLVDVFHQMTWREKQKAKVRKMARKLKTKENAQVFLSIAPIALSCSSTRMHLSDISLDCSGS